LSPSSGSLDGSTTGRRERTHVDPHSRATKRGLTHSHARV